MKQPKFPLTDEWINKMWYVPIVKYYSALKRNEILIHTPTWVNFEDITLSKTRQTPKHKYCTIPLM